MTATTTTRIIASAVTADGWGDREVIIQPQTVEGDYIATHVDVVLARRALPPRDEFSSGTADLDADKALAWMGYRRTREWEGTDFGAVAIVEAL